MDKYLRCFIKYQTYMIVVFTMQMVLALTPAMAQSETYGIENIRFGGIVALIFGISWTLAVISLGIAIQKEDKRFIYPYVFVFGLDLSLLILREFYVMIRDGIFIEILTVKIFFAALVIPYVVASLFALHRLFTVDPIETHRIEGFVRFDRNELTGVEESQISSTSAPANHSTPVL
uniref:Uncharacterized protein n=1 Tax=Anopheles christyi TaxID=43041 RepID=A0A182JUE0_9DIPT